MNSPKEEKNLIEFDVSKFNITTGANVTFSMIHPSLASSINDSFKNPKMSEYFIPATSQSNKIMTSSDELEKYEQLIKNMKHQSNIKAHNSNSQDDSYFDFSEYNINESPERKIKKVETVKEKIDTNEITNKEKSDEEEKNINQPEKIEQKLSNEVLLKKSLNSLKITLNMEIKITGYVIKNIIFQHIKYILTITKFDKSNTEYTYKIYRRYSEFQKLRDMLIKKYIGIFLPSLPRKQIFGSTDINLIEFRKKFLQIFLHELQLCYFFNESEEIQAFLDPTIEVFPPENLKILGEMNKMSEEFLFDEISEILKKTYKLNLELCIDNNLDTNNSNKETPNASPEINLKKETNYKNLDLSVIPDKLKNLNEFNTRLSKQKEFLENVRICLNHFIPQQKEFSMISTNFTEKLLEFQNNCIFPMMENRNSIERKIKTNKPKNHDVIHFVDEKITNNISFILSKVPVNISDINEILLQKKKKSFSGVLKNLHDWIYKEVIDSDSISECIGGMKFYLHRLREIEAEKKKFDLILSEKNQNHFNKQEEIADYGEIAGEYTNLDLKENLEKNTDRLKEIIAMTTLNLHDYEIEKFKNMKFQYYYNSLTFLIKHNNSYIENEEKLFLTIIENILQNLTKSQ